MSVDAKKTIIGLLNEDKIVVLDDDTDAETVTVSGAWPQKDSVYPCVSIGPLINEDEGIMDLGGASLRCDGSYQFDIWVKEPDDKSALGKNYKASEMLELIKQEVRRLIWKSTNAPGGNLKHVWILRWGPELPEEEEPLSRITGRIGYMWDEARPTS